MSLVFHSYEDSSVMPSKVLQLVQLLNKALPGPLKTALHASAPCSSARTAIQETLRPSSDLACATSVEDVFSKLVDVLDMTLLTSTAIREQTSISDEHGQRSTIAQWYTFLKTLGRVCYPNSRMLADGRFVHPRGFDGSEEGTATLLIGFAAESSMFSSSKDSSLGDRSTPGEEKSLGTDCRSSATDSQPDDARTSESTSDANNPVYVNVPTYRILGDAEALFLTYEKEVEEPGEEVLLELPLEAHMLAGKDERCFVFFPVICVADKDDIAPLVASTICHRNAWGMDIPAVGLQISECGSLVHVYIAWTEASTGENQMPTIHMIRPDYGGSSALPELRASPGNFDLADLSSIVQLALFVLSLSRQFDSLQQELPPQFPGNLSWRADLSHTNSLHARITHWLQTIDMFPVTISSTARCSSCRNTCTKLRIRSANRADVEDTTDSDPVGKRSKPPTRSHDQKKNRHRRSHLSCQEFAERDRRITAKNPKVASISSWLVQRRAFTLARVQQLDDIPLDFKPEGFDAMINLYYQMTSFQLINEWNGDDAARIRAMPVDKCFERYRNALADAYACVLGARKLSNAEENVVDNMNPEHGQIVMSRLSLLLKAVVGDASREAQPTEPDEAECRREWDALLETFYVKNLSEVASNAVLLKRRLMLSKNILYQAFRSGNGSGMTAQLAADLEAYDDHIDAVYDYHIDHKEKLAIVGSLRRTLQQQCIQVENEVITQQGIYDPEEKGLAKMVKKNSKHEPYVGTCDAVLFTSVSLHADDWTANEKETYERFQLVKSESAGPYPDLRAAPNAVHCPKILLPQLLVEHGNPDKSVHVALNQGRMYCVSSISFLQAVGITEYPVFGLVTDGPIGAIIMAWMSKEGRIYLLERNVQTFDLRQPLEVYQFVTFLLRLRACDQAMDEAFKPHEEELKRQVEENKLLKWYMSMTKTHIQ